MLVTKLNLCLPSATSIGGFYIINRVNNNALFNDVSLESIGNYTLYKWVCRFTEAIRIEKVSKGHTLYQDLLTFDNYEPSVKIKS